jgi:hypothetical protein
MTRAMVMRGCGQQGGRGQEAGGPVITTAHKWGVGLVSIGRIPQ